MANQHRRKDPSAMIAVINQYLIRCHISLQLQIPDPELALHNADVALWLAQSHNLWRMEGKAQRLRGHCFRALGRWRQAYNCYVRGASALDASISVEILTKECLEMLQRPGEKTRDRKLKLAPPEPGPVILTDKEHHRSGVAVPDEGELEHQTRTEDVKRSTFPRLRRVAGRLLEGHRTRVR